jgi:hypothetical protein
MYDFGTTCDFFPDSNPDADCQGGLLPDPKNPPLHLQIHKLEILIREDGQQESIAIMQRQAPPLEHGRKEIRGYGQPCHHPRLFLADKTMA